MAIFDTKEEIINKNIFVDSSLQQKKEFIISCFEAVKKLAKENFYFFFLNENKSQKFFKKIEHIRLQHEFSSDDAIKEFKELENHLRETKTSFSWGYQDCEFVFIILTIDSDIHFLDHPTALIGLLIHETLHGIERQRGLEDDLKRSLAITLDTFSNFAEMIPIYNKDELISVFRIIGETAVYVLKDLYVDREAIERGFGTEILEQYKALFNLNNGLDGTKMERIDLVLDEISKTQGKTIDLEEFKTAFIILLGLVPCWLPFIKISKGYEREQALEIREFIDKTYNQVSLISERFRHLENVYLTEFAFTKTFHTAWFSEVFSIVIDLLSGGEFIVWQFSYLVIKLEDYLAKAKEINGTTDTYTLQDLILVPVLKAAYLFSKQSSNNLDLINQEINEKLKQHISPEELVEWEQDYQEYSIENLLLFVLSELLRILRLKFLDTIQNLRLYTGLILNTLQILIDIKKDVKYLNEYHIMKNLILQFVTERDSRFGSLKILYPLEFQLEQMMYEEEPAFTPDQAEEFLLIGRFYTLPKLNWVLELAKKIAGIIKVNIKKANSKNEPIDTQVIAMTMVVLTKDFHMDIDQELLIPLARSVLIALNIPMPLIKEIVYSYGYLLNM